MQYFKIEEFACPCCGTVEMDGIFLGKIDKARYLAGIPFNINSGYRCERHNKEVGSTSNNHTTGHAADIRCTDSRSRYIIIDALIDAGFDRVGIAKTFIHCDDNPDKSKKVMWTY